MRGSCLCFLLFALAFTPRAHAQDIVLTAAPVKPIFKAGEAVRVKFGLRNVSKNSVLVGRSFALSYFIGMNITGPDGPAAWCGRILRATEVPYTILRPGAQVSRVVAISCLNDTGYHMKKAGVYHVRASYMMPTPTAAFRKAVGSDVLIPRGPIYADSFDVTVN
jgi:hypothetical protein